MSKETIPKKKRFNRFVGTAEEIIVNGKPLSKALKTKSVKKKQPRKHTA